jgi:uncharacterized protein YoxC
VVGSVSLGGIAAIVLAAFWAVLVLFMAIVLVNLFRVLESTKGLIDGITKETVPLLSEVTVTVTNVNRELDTVHGVTESAGKIVKSVERLSGVVEQTVSSPLIKVASAGYGLTRGLRKVGKK